MTAAPVSATYESSGNVSPGSTTVGQAPTTPIAPAPDFAADTPVLPFNATPTLANATAPAVRGRMNGEVVEMRDVTFTRAGNTWAVHLRQAAHDEPGSAGNYANIVVMLHGTPRVGHAQASRPNETALHVEVNDPRPQTNSWQGPVINWSGPDVGWRVEFTSFHERGHYNPRMGDDEQVGTASGRIIVHLRGGDPSQHVADSYVAGVFTNVPVEYRAAD